MADSEDDTRDSTESQELPPADAVSPPEVPASSALLPASPAPPMPAPRTSMLERWRTPLIVALAVLFLVFGALDVSSILFHSAQVSGTTRPLIVNAQVVGDTPAAAAHPDLGLAPAALTIVCGKTARVTVTNRSERPLQWTVTTDNDAITFSADTARTGLLAPGQSSTLTVLAFSQPGTYLLQFSDDHGESADVTVQVSC